MTRALFVLAVVLLAGLLYLELAPAGGTEDVDATVCYSPCLPEK